MRITEPGRLRGNPTGMKTFAAAVLQGWKWYHRQAAAGMVKKCGNKYAFYCNAAVAMHLVAIKNMSATFFKNSFLWKCKITHQLWFSGIISDICSLHVDWHMHQQAMRRFLWGWVRMGMNLCTMGRRMKGTTPQDNINITQPILQCEMDKEGYALRCNQFFLLCE